MNGLDRQRQTFGQQQFGNAQFGDKRRTRRIVSLADQLSRHPGGTWPEKLSSPAELKAFYRLMDCETVTHATMLAPHRQQVGQRINDSQEPVLLLHDATELDYSKRHSLDLGQIGNGHGRGYICHNSLAVGADSKEVLGLRQQILHRRETVDKSETAAERRRRESRESRLWVDAVRDDGPYDTKVIDVCDRGGDTFEMLDFEIRHGRSFVIRSNHNRRIALERGEGLLHEHARRLPMCDEYELKTNARGKQPARTARVGVSAGEVWVLPPKDKSGDHGNEPLRMYVVRIWELDPPETIRVPIGPKRKGKRRQTRQVAVEPIEWFLLTSEEVTDSESAWRTTGYYETRWVIEEYHKAQKTGCSIESFQFTSEARLQPAIALMSVIATTLLQLRNAARRPDAKQRLATTLISSDYVRLLCRWRHGKEDPKWTVHDFYMALARLGGHQNRKWDHQPGWLVLWRGWTKLQHMIDGAHCATS